MTFQDFLAETYYRFKVPLFEWKEQRWVSREFYKEANFKALDQELLSGPNPYSIAEVFPYGETQLRTLYSMAQAINLKPNDHFVDLGCGRGRAVFFLSYFFGCKATGIDLTSSFIKKAQRLAKTHHQERVSFLCQDFLTYDFQEATCVYLYGISYSDECLQQLKERLAKLPSGSRFITVSEPLSEINQLHQFVLFHQLKACFTWGRSSIFLHYKV